jgi:hypothetical protein
MATYGVTVYGKQTYGQPLFTAFDTGYMAAEQTAYGQLEVSWGTPLQTATSAIISGTQNWTLLRLVRNSYGVPDTEDDGDVLLEITASAPDNSYIDRDVVPGRYYYYGVFVAVPLQTYSSTAIYQPGMVVTYSSVSYQCLAANTTAVTPGTNPTVWAVVSLTATWTRCGGVVGLPVQNAGHTQVAYDLIPRPYKVARVESTASSIPVNDQLYRFCDVFGFHLDIIKAEHNALVRMNDVVRCTDAQLSLIATEMGVSDRLPALPAMRRAFVRDSVEIQRAKGTPAGVAQLIKSLSGWDSLVQIGYNQLHDQDEAAFATPQYPSWDSSTVYHADSTLGTGDRVWYSNNLYQARGAVVRRSAYLLNHAGGLVTTDSGTGPLKDFSSLASAYRWYLWADNTPNTWTTLSITLATPPMGAGDYSIAVGYIGDPYSGAFDVRIAEGNQILDLETDLYAPEYDTVIRKGYGRVTLGASTSTLTFTTTTPNSFSRGEDLNIDWIELTPYTTPSGVRPTGDTASASYWTSLTLSSALTDPNLGMRNYTTNGFSNWNVVTTTGAVNPLTTTVVPPPGPTGWWISPFGATVGTAAPGGNSLVYSNPTGGSVGPVQIMTCGWTQASTWTTTSEASAGAPVIWPAGGDVWLSNSAHHKAVPGVDFGWDDTTIVNGVNLVKPEPWLVQRQAVPIRRLVSWRADASYNVKDQVAWGGHRYEAALANKGSAPSGSDLDTMVWRWIGSNLQQYTFSIYHYRTATGTGQHVRPYITWFDTYGNVLATAQVQNSQQLLYDRFEVDGTTYPSGGTPGSWTTPAAWQQGTGLPWAQNWGSWTTVNGMAYPVPGSWSTPSGTTTATALSVQQAGRVLSFYRSAVNAGSSGEQVYATFISTPSDSAALGTLEHGIAFRLSVGTGYWMASRDRLTYIANATNGTPTAYPSPGQTPTVVATWTSIPNYTRMRVTNTATTVKVEVMYPTGPGTWFTLANVSDSTHYQTQTGYGLIERVRQ